MNSYLRKAACGAFAWSVLSAWAFAAPTTDAQQIEHIENGLRPAQVLKGKPLVLRSLAEEMRRLNVPGVSVAVIHGGRIAWAKGYGVTTAGGAAVTAATLFQAASISKSITAMGALQIAQAGLVDLDRNVNEYLPAWKLAYPAGVDQVSLRQLLSHTAGTTVSGFPGYAPGSAVPTLLQVLDGARPASTEAVRVTSTPGVEWRYSGGGYTVIQQMMMNVAGKPFDALMTERVLRPLGMSDSSFTQPLSAAIAARAAMPHDGAGRPYPGGPNTYPELAAAGMWTTPTDLARFALSLQASAHGRSGQMLSAATRRAMLTPVKNGYALGLEIAGEGTARSFAHGGSNRGYQNSLFAYSEQGEGAVVMTNSDAGADLARAVIRAIAAEYRWPSYQTVERTATPVSAAAAARLAGKYAIEGLGDFEITNDSGQPVFWLKAGQGEPLYAESPGKLFILSQQLELHLDSPTAEGGRLVAGPFDVRFKRIP